MFNRRETKMIRIIETKICKVCEITFPRPSGKSDKVWEKQKCCGGSCAAISRRKANPVRLDRRVKLVAGEGRYKGWVKKKQQTSNV